MLLLDLVRIEIHPRSGQIRQRQNPSLRLKRVLEKVLMDLVPFDQILL